MTAWSLNSSQLSLYAHPWYLGLSVMIASTNTMKTWNICVWPKSTPVPVIVTRSPQWEPKLSASWLFATDSVNWLGVLNPWTCPKSSVWNNPSRSSPSHLGNLSSKSNGPIDSFKSQFACIVWSVFCLQIIKGFWMFNFNLRSQGKSPGQWTWQTGETGWRVCKFHLSIQ